MKTRSDPRHLKRIRMVQQLFASEFLEKYQSNPKSNLPTEIREVLPEIDIRIARAAPQFPVDKIAKIDAAILRIAIYELFYKKEVPFRVVVDEAVELAKEFGGESSPSFINGVLGTLLKQLS